MARNYASNQQIITLAKWMVSNGHLEAKPYLEPVKYQARVNGVVYNFDYKLVQLAIDIYKSLAAPTA